MLTNIHCTLEEAVFDTTASGCSRNDFVVDFNADFDDGSTQLLRGSLDSSSLGDSTFDQVDYVTNLTSGIQYKWLPENSMWVKSFEGFYEPGTWSIEF